MKSAVQSNCEKQFLLKGIQERKVGRFLRIRYQYGYG